MGYSLSTRPNKTQPRPSNKSSAVAEMGDHLATIDNGRKVGATVPFWGEGS